MANPVAYPGRGTVIAFAPIGSSTFTTMPQLEKFERTGSKVEFDDATCIDSPGNNKFPVPVVVDNGKYTGEGVFDPQNVGITQLLSVMQSMTQMLYKITLIDGSIFTGNCYVEQFDPPKVDRYKVNRFSFGIIIYGVEVLTPLGGSGINE